jgi:protein-S-isoprenylcysteine O-methyltransferase Ste14
LGQNPAGFLLSCGVRHRSRSGTGRWADSLVAGALLDLRRRLWLFLIGMGIVTWAEAVKKCFEVTVRIQAERGQKVIDTGPYAIVRHPGYVGGIFFFVGRPYAWGQFGRWSLRPLRLPC